MFEHEFKLKPSKQLLALSYAIFIGSLFIIAQLAIHYALKLLLIPIVVLYMVWIVRRQGKLLSARSILCLLPRADGTWCLRDKLNLIQDAVLCGSSIVTSKVSVLRFKLPNTKSIKTCIVFSDALKQGEYRRLVASLRH